MKDYIFFSCAWQHDVLNRILSAPDLWNCLYVVVLNVWSLTLWGFFCLFLSCGVWWCVKERKSNVFSDHPKKSLKMTEIFLLIDMWRKETRLQGSRKLFTWASLRGVIRHSWRFSWVQQNALLQVKSKNTLQESKSTANMIGTLVNHPWLQTCIRLNICLSLQQGLSVPGGDPGWCSDQGGRVSIPARCRVGEATANVLRFLSPIYMTVSRTMPEWILPSGMFIFGGAMALFLPQAWFSLLCSFASFLVSSTHSNWKVVEWDLGHSACYGFPGFTGFLFSVWCSLQAVPAQAVSASPPQSSLHT